jgi:hypothetical protein
MRSRPRFPLPALLLLVVLLAVLVLVFATPRPANSQAARADAATAAAQADAAPPAPTHRPLRDHRPPDLPPPTQPEVFTGYPDAPPFDVVTRQQHLALFPCAQCHAVLPTNTTPRQLIAAPHAAALEHGRGRMWCLDCHSATNRNELRGIDSRRIGFNESHMLCGQCHSERHRDWHYGAHGKRVINWKGERQIYACTHCHDPHRPALAPREPSPPPRVRAGLTPPTPHEIGQHLPTLLQRLEQGVQDARHPAR